MTKFSLVFTVIMIAFGVSGCGTTLPITDLRHSSDEEFNAFVDGIVGHVRCEMTNAVNLNYDDDATARRHILKDWGAKVALTIRALDKGNFNPTISAFNNPVTFTFAATGTFEADGTRELTMTYFLPFAELIDNHRHGPNANWQPYSCPNADEAIGADLGIKQTVTAALQPWDTRGTLADELVKGPFDTITHHVIFVTIAGAGVTPTWKLVNISANSTAPFLGANRTSTDELLITMGPTQLKGVAIIANGGKRRLARVVPTAGTSLDESFAIERIRSALTPNK